MPQPPWIVLNAVQLGVLVALVVSYGAEALRRRHRAFGLLVTGGILLGIRHLVFVFGPSWGLAPASIDRLQSPFGFAGFVLSIQAMGLMVSKTIPPALISISYLALFLNLLRAALFPPGSPWDVWSLRLILCSILLISLASGTLVIRAALRKDPVAQSLVIGLAMGLIPAAAEAGVRLAFGLSVPLSGFAYLLLSVSLVNTWLSLQNLELLHRLEHAERQSLGWRALLPGPAYRIGESSPWMERVFGNDWEAHLKDRMEAADHSYRIHRAFPGTPFDQGWVEELPHAPRPDLALLQGWSVGLGLDERDDPEGIQRLLEDWGARVQCWGIVPPRQGPFPSLLLWSREPRILAVWREDELSRRRCRWIQVGGAEIEGPHARLERPLHPQALHDALKGLLSLPVISPPTTPLEAPDDSGRGPWPL